MEHLPAMPSVPAHCPEEACPGSTQFLPVWVLHASRVHIPFESVGMDLVGPFPKSAQGHEYILVSWTMPHNTGDCVLLLQPMANSWPIGRAHTLSWSGWALYIITSPTVAVPKPNGSLQICNNFWRVNHIMTSTATLSPWVYDLVDHLGRA